MLLQSLRNPAALEALSAPDWDLLIRLSRKCRLLPRLAWLTGQADIEGRIPERAVAQLTGASRLCEQTLVGIDFEVDRIERALRELDVTVVLLKGCAYRSLRLSTSKGRAMADVDIMVSRFDIERTESALISSGWQSRELSDYDDRYYREWTHELPPLAHPQRAIEVDLHHGILPPTGRLKPDSMALLSEARQLTDSSLYVLAPEDMVLHAAVHLFQSGEIGGAIRELVDIDGLLREFGSEDAFWRRLVSRGEELGLSRPLYYAIHFSSRLLDTPTEAAAVDEIQRPSLPVRTLMDVIVPAALVPSDPDRLPPLERIAVFMLYVRSHWLRMPPIQLARHLGYKSWVRLLAWWQTRDASRDDRV